MRRGKYNVAPKKERTLAGVTYMSKLEMQYKAHLNVLKKAKYDEDKVIKVEEQVPFSIEINGKLICHYIIDFIVTYGDGRVEHVDVKGVKTDVYKLKKKMFEAVYPYKIKEVIKGQF